MKNRNFLVKILSLLLCLTIGLFTACNPAADVNNDVVDENNLNIMILIKGYGVNWCKNLAREFENKNPGVKVHVEDVYITTSISTSMQKGKAKNDTDLYFVVENGQSASLVEAYAPRDGGLYDLTNLYNTVIPGESKTFGEKMNASIKDQFNINGKYYTFPWATSSMGIFYNETVLNNVLGENNWSIPNTSDELIELGDAFKNKENNKFLLYCGTLDSITNAMFLSWWAQYEGLNNYNMFWKGQYFDEVEGEISGNSNKIFTQQGRLEAMKVCETLCRPDNGYAVPYASSRGEQEYRTYQTQFFTSSNKYALYPGGDWLFNESGTDSNSTVKMMKTPVISSIINKCLSIEDDDELSALITAIDSGSTDLVGTGYNVEQEDYDRIKEARTIVSSNANLQLGFIPSYANAAGLAEKFLLFMASDEGLQIFKNSVVGGFAPFECDYETGTFNEYEKSVLNVIKDANFVQNSLMNPLFYKTGIFSVTTPSSNMDIAFNVAQGTGTYRTAQQFYDYFVNTYNAEAWKTVLKKL